MASNSVENAQNTEPKDATENPRAKGADSAAERGLDKTLADSFPTSDPPSSIPNPGEHHAPHSHASQLAGLAPGTWAALSLEDDSVIATGKTRDEAEHSAMQKGQRNFELICVAQSGPSQAA